ncbi:MAG TPA: NUDIX hydrolase [Micromonospora sp.]
MRRRRIAAHGLCRDDEGRTLLVRGDRRAEFPGRWRLPGGEIRHGEHPALAVVRAIAAQTGLRASPTDVRAVLADVLTTPDGRRAHTDRIVYAVTVAPAPAVRPAPAEPIDRVAWIAPDRLPEVPLAPFTAEMLGLPPGPVPEPALPVDALATEERAGRPARGQRFGAYALATDPAGRVLLTLIADGYPGAGRWHLPGGGTDHGEQPATALLRELAEETDQVGRITDLLAVDHHHNPAAIGPEGYPLDWHVVRVIYRVLVDVPTEPRVTEDAGGSTASARWFAPAELAHLRLTDVAATALRYLPR